MHVCASRRDYKLCLCAPGRYLDATACSTSNKGPSSHQWERISWGRKDFTLLYHGMRGDNSNMLPYLVLGFLFNPTANAEVRRSELRWRTGPVQRNAAVPGTTCQGEQQSACRSRQLYLWQVRLRLKPSRWKLKLRYDMKVCSARVSGVMTLPTTQRGEKWSDAKRKKTKRPQSLRGLPKSMMRPGCINSVRERDRVWRRERRQRRSVEG